jgi:hypothetical protein
LIVGSTKRNAVVAADHEPHRQGDVLDVDAEVGGAIAVDHDPELGLSSLSVVSASAMPPISSMRVRSSLPRRAAGGPARGC